jgi:hypothetical protein
MPQKQCQIIQFSWTQIPFFHELAQIEMIKKSALAIYGVGKSRNSKTLPSNRPTATIRLANEEANLGRDCSVRPLKSKTAAPMFVSMCELVFQRQEDGVMRMGEIDIHDYARQLLEAHGEMAVVEAAQKARNFEEKGETEEAETWRGIEAALKQMRGPHVS